MAWWGAAAGTAGLLLAGVGLLIADSRAGLDLTDESLYLLAADNHQPAAGLNGWFGRYTGLLFAATGYDVAWFRTVGVVVLVASAVVLGVALVGLLGDRSGARVSLPGQVVIVAGTAGGALINYALFIRTPGYNWLTFVGAMLAAAGTLKTLSSRDSDLRAAVLAGALLALGCFLALWGKASAGIGLAALATVIGVAATIADGQSRVRVGISAIGLGIVFLALHSLFIADPGTTIATLQRSFAMLTVIDPRTYEPAGAIALTLADIARAGSRVFDTTSGLPFLGLAPLLAAPVARPSRAPAALGLVLVAVGIVALVLFARGEWVGGVRGYATVAIADLAILATAVIAAISSAVVLWIPGGPEGIGGDRLLGLAALGLLGAGGAYAFGSANGFVAQSTGAAVLVLAASALLVAAPLPRPLAVRTMAFFGVLMAVVSVTVLASARASPYRIAPLESASVAIEFGPHRRTLLVDPTTASYWGRLEAAARTAGWLPGTRLLDLTWSPAVPYDLDARVPETLVPTVNDGTADASAMEALRVSDAGSWSEAWLLVPPDANDVHPARILAAIGRSFPSDYELVASLTAPGLGVRQELWRPID